LPPWVDGLKLLKPGAGARVDPSAASGVSGPLQKAVKRRGS
jgi:hypothetical protein